MARMELPVRAIPEQSPPHRRDRPSGPAVRRFPPITHVSEIVGHGGRGSSALQDIFGFDLRSGYDEQGHPIGTLRWTGLRPRLLDTLANRGIEVPVDLFKESEW